MLNIVNQSYNNIRDLRGQSLFNFHNDNVAKSAVHLVKYLRVTKTYVYINNVCIIVLITVIIILFK